MLHGIALLHKVGPEVPQVPHLPTVPEVPGVPHLPTAPEVPGGPATPDGPGGPEGPAPPGAIGPLTLLLPSRVLHCTRSCSADDMYALPW